MNKAIFKQMRRTVSIVILVAFISTSVKSPAYAQLTTGNQLPWMPVPGVRISLSPEFTPAILKGITIHPNNPLQFDFIILRGDTPLSDTQKRVEYKKLIKYFLASLTVPESHQWVNLSPYEKTRIINKDLGLTEMGRDMLAQDYVLKQLTASLIYPESNLGKKFWDKVYSQGQEQFGTTSIPVNTFNKVWIVPDDAQIFEKGNTAYVISFHLKVMLEEDYMSLKEHSGIESVAVKQTQAHALGSRIIKEIVLPELEREVNQDKNFANLRQVFSGVILAAWFKQTLKQSLLGQIYANKDKIKGVDQNPKNNELIYQRYLRAYKKGVFNYIKEDIDKYTNETIPRKYFSGGMQVPDLAMYAHITKSPEDAIKVSGELSNDDDAMINMQEATIPVNAAMTTNKGPRYDAQVAALAKTKPGEQVREAVFTDTMREATNQWGQVIPAGTVFEDPNGDYWQLTGRIGQFIEMLDDDGNPSLGLVAKLRDSDGKDANGKVKWKWAPSSGALATLSTLKIILRPSQALPKTGGKGFVYFKEDEYRTATELNSIGSTDLNELTLLVQDLFDTSPDGDGPISITPVLLKFKNINNVTYEQISAALLYFFTSISTKRLEIISGSKKTDHNWEIGLRKVDAAMTVTKEMLQIAQQTVNEVGTLRGHDSQEQAFHRLINGKIERLVDASRPDLRHDAVKRREFINQIVDMFIVNTEKGQYGAITLRLRLKGVKPLEDQALKDRKQMEKEINRINIFVNAKYRGFTKSTNADNFHEWRKLDRELSPLFFEMSKLNRSSETMPYDQLNEGFRRAQEIEARFKAIPDAAMTVEELVKSLDLNYQNAFKSYFPESNEVAIEWRKAFASVMGFFAQKYAKPEQSLSENYDYLYQFPSLIGGLRNTVNLKNLGSKTNRNKLKNLQRLGEILHSTLRSKFQRSFTNPSIRDYIRLLSVNPNGFNVEVQKITREHESKPKARDNAMNGGIDFNTANFNLKIKRDGNGVPLPIAQQDMAQLGKIDGLVPEIVTIKPATSMPLASELQTLQ